MNSFQKGILGLLLIFMLMAVSALGFTAWSGWPAAAAPQAPEKVAEEQVVEVAAAGVGESFDQVIILEAGITRTPFQPFALRPTETPTRLPTYTPTPTQTPLPTATPTPLFDDEVFIGGIYGFPQTYNLSCESRSASDLARYFGVNFSELDFLIALPDSDNPNLGFVGDVRGSLGQLPPLGYGVHAGPVAELMVDFGLDARAKTGLTLEDLKIALSAGRPVMIWAISEMGYSEPVQYEASNGESVTVARFEHTFIVIGYGEDYVTVLDNERVYSVTNAQFLRSWGTLGNMGIVIRE